MVRSKGVVVKNASVVSLAAAAARMLPTHGRVQSPPPQPVEKRLSRKKKSKLNSSKKKDVFSTYIYRVLKQIHPDGMTISANAMSTMNSMMKDLFEKLTNECARLVKYTKRATLTPRDVQTAVRLVFPGELAKHAVSEGSKAVTKFYSTK